jgi:hypothetical protein
MLSIMEKREIESPEALETGGLFSPKEFARRVPSRPTG